MSLKIEKYLKSQEKDIKTQTIKKLIHIALFDENKNIAEEAYQTLSTIDKQLAQEVSALNNNKVIYYETKITYFERIKNKVSKFFKSNF